jgi:hypothetical protein
MTSILSIAATLVIGASVAPPARLPTGGAWLVGSAFPAWHVRP